MHSTARVTPATLPALKGDGRYRVYTVEHLPFDALPAYDEGGPATVRGDEWNVSTSHLSAAFASPSVVAADDGMYTLSVFKFTHPGGGADLVRHPLDGTKYATRRDANRAAYEAGLLGFMVYESDAPSYGLPTADDQCLGCRPHDLSEVRLSDCRYGCKVMTCSGCHVERVVHMASYGCPNAT